MAQQMQAHATKLGITTPGICMVEGENPLLQIVL